ncbi:uncharacterized protein LOC131028847 isoform X1 [Cryptomeria japonica]|uniref:uncharacterized protein LOC131028847 isoform X1 n=1 Tax=Cryptomeria japonica TaxID=3369 RepID=UPI0025AD80AE|nr:uncharacterized protein LOC131028847 isoform X1 [Cryptomeria japonica]
MGKGGFAVEKPSRSDEMIDVQQQMRIAAEVQYQFDAMAPKRHRKPDRSERSDEADGHVEDPYDEDQIIPELIKFQELRSRGFQPVFVSAKGEILPEEFVETDYYKNLIAEGKIHYTTGNGYIKLDYDGGSYFRLSNQDNGDMERIHVRSNPAMNDWIPASEDTVIPVSSKPDRSG